MFTKLLSLVIAILTATAALFAQRPLVRYQEFFSGQDMAHTRVSSFYQDSEGFLWMGSWIGLCRYDGQQFTFFRATPDNHNPQSNNRMTKIGETPDGMLWCQSYDGQRYLFDRQRCTFDLLPTDSLPARPAPVRTKVVRSWSMTDNYGVHWMMDGQEHLCWVDSLTGRLRPVEEALDERHHGILPIDDYHVFFADQSRNLWVSSGTRLFRLSFGQRQTRVVPLPELDEIRSMMRNDDGSLLVGDKQAHLCRMRLDKPECEYLSPRGQWQKEPVRFARQGIYCLLCDSRQRLWVGTRGDGLYCVDGTEVMHFIHADADAYSLPSDDIYDLMEGEDGRLWIATFEGGGLCRLDWQPEGTAQFLHHGNSWPEYPKEATFVRCVEQDAKGRILAGTNEGLLVHQPATGQWELLRHQSDAPSSLAGNMVMAILSDGQHTFVQSYGFAVSPVVETGQEELSFQNGIFHNYPNGDVCVSAQLDRQGRVWGICESGFSRYSCDSTYSTTYFNDFDFDGRYTFSEVQPLLLPSGEMLLGMRGGLFVFNTDSLHKQHISPRINVTRISFPGLPSEQPRYVCGLDSLSLTPDRRSVSIQFSAMDFESSALKRYAYRLIELSDSKQPEWTTTTVPEVNFINLPAGHFELQMRSTNADGVWCDNDKAITLLVIPTFWETPWAWLLWLLVVVILATIIGYVVTYIQRLHRQKIELEAILERHLRAEIVTTSQEMTAQHKPVEGEMDPFLSSLMAYIEAHIADDSLSVPLLAEQMCMSQATLYRKLKTMVGLTPADFFRKVKMRRAVQYLETTDMKISQVAYSVGFSDPKYFSKCFKHDMGLTPLEYRQKYQHG